MPFVHSNFRSLFVVDKIQLTISRENYSLLIIFLLYLRYWETGFTACMISPVF